MTAQQALTLALAVMADAGKVPPCQGRRRDRWTSDNADEREWAARVCSSLGCPVMAECLAAAVELKAKHFVWGGVDLSAKGRQATAFFGERPL